MNASNASFHLDGNEVVRVNGSENHDAVYIDDARTTSSLCIVLPTRHPTADRVRFLRDLAGELTHLAYTLEERETLAVTR